MSRVHESADGVIRDCTAATPDACRAKGPDGAHAQHYSSVADYEAAMARENSAVPIGSTVNTVAGGSGSHKRPRATPETFAGMNLPDLTHDDSFPRPQANRAERLASVVKAVHAGADDTQSLKIALNEAGDRDARYYADAAGYLGLLEVTGPGEFQTTEAGNYLALSDDSASAAIIAERIKGTPEFQSFVTEGGEEGIRGVMLEETDLNDNTINRRVATAMAWADFVAEVDSAAINDSTATSGTQVDLEAMRERLEEAKADRARRLEEAARAAEAAKPKLCPTHFIQLSANGSCSFCE